MRDAPPSSRSVRKRRDAGTRGPAPAEIVFGVVLYTVAFILRLGVASWLAGEPVWDGHYYDFGAKRIADGLGYSDDRAVGGHLEWHPWCHYPVGYSGFLAGFYKLLGQSAGVAHFANALTGALLAIVVWLLAREGMSNRRARVAGLLTALHPGLVLYGALVMSEPLSALLVMTAFFVAVRYAKRRPFPAIAGAALILGLGVLVRPQAILCAPLLALAVPRIPYDPDLEALMDAAGDGPTPSIVERITGSTWGRRAIAAVIACSVVFVPVLPWTYRNCEKMDGCALVSTNAGWNLAIGAFPRATGRFETLRSSDGCREVTGQVQQDRCWFSYGVANIRQTPKRWLALVPAKLGFTFDHESFAIEYLHEARPEAWPEARRSRGRALLTGLFRLILLAASFASVARIFPRRRRSVEETFPSRRAAEREARLEIVRMVVQGVLAVALLVAGGIAFAADTPVFWPFAVVVCLLPCLPFPGRPKVTPAIYLPVALVASVVLAHAVFFGEDRYHVVATPALCLLAAAAFRRSYHRNDEPADA